MNIVNLDREIESIRIAEKCGEFKGKPKSKITVAKTTCDTCQNKYTCSWEEFIVCEKQKENIK